MPAFDPAAHYVLENDVVLLRPLETGDFTHLLYFSLNEPELWNYSSTQPTGKDALEHYIQSTLDARAAGKEYPFIVFDKRSGRYAGSTRFYDIQPPYATLQLGYTWYGKAFQRTGLNRHCKLLLLQFAFEELHMQRVEFRANSKNERSIDAMKNIGCTVEGVLRSTGDDLVFGGRRDSIVLSILKDEWHGSVKKGLEEKIR
jgi:RimJ/RimL family protein N-acetyltransferase